MITDQSSDLRAGVPAQQPEPGESSTRSCLSKGYLPPLRPHPIVSLLSTPISILITSFVLFTSCTSPTPPPPPPPPPTGPDTTSHEFIWQVDTLGDGNSSVLYDVAIINDTTIWAVGEIYLKDSTGQVDPTAYNLARWNGSSWSLSRVPLRDFGSPTFGYYPIRAVLAFSSSDVWVADAGGLAHFDGHNWGRWTVLFNDLNDPTFGATNKMWGSSNDDIYIVGNRGSITHFDGTTWRRIESGTGVDLVDVWGSPDVSSVWTCGWQNTTQTLLLRMDNGVSSVQYRDSDHLFTIRTDSLSGRLGAGQTFVFDVMFVLSPAGLYRGSTMSSGQAERLSFAESFFPGFPTGLSGNSANDVMIVGQRGMLAHYNGSSWRWFTQFSNDAAYLNSVEMSRGLVVAVGTLRLSGFEGRAMLIRGYRR